MKLWAVWSIDWEDQDLLSLWTTKDLAEAELKRLGCSDREWYGAQLTIREHEVDTHWED